MECPFGDLSDAALVAAHHANLFAYMVHLGRSPTTKFRQGPPLTWMLSGLLPHFLNQVFVELLTADEADRVIDEALAYLRSRHVLGAMWSAQPGVDPAEMGRRLAAHGLVFEEGQRCMAADLLASNEANSPPEGLTIQPVEDDDMLRDWARAVWEGFGLPAGSWPQYYDFMRGVGFGLPIRQYLGCLNGVPVAGSQLFASAGVAGIYHVATLPDARRRGIGASMSLAAMRDACSLGYRVAVLNATEMGFPVYRRLGFKEVGRMSHWVWQETP